MKKVLLFSALLLLFSCDVKKDKEISGYVEGEFVYVSPTTSGNLKKLFVTRGQEVRLGDKLFAIDITNLEAVLKQAKAEVEQAVSQYADLTKGKRPEEIKVIMKQKDQAEANLVNAKKEYDRYVELAKTDYASKSALDEKTAAYKSFEAQVQEFAAQLKVAMLGARDDQVLAAQHAIDAAKQRVVQAERNLADAMPRAEVDGRVEETYFRVGEFVQAGTPVVSILPPENVKVRFFVPQKMVPEMILNRKIKIDCDGCAKPIEAEINFVSSQAEFTPPIIYSVESREKLVFMVEARPLEFVEALRPGLPINIVLE